MAANGAEKDTAGFWAGIARIRDVAFIVAVYLFFAGFIYRYYYLTSFGLDPKFDDAALYTVLVYAYSVFDDAVGRSAFATRWIAWLALAVAIAAIAADALLRHVRKPYQRRRKRVVLEIRRLALPVSVTCAVLLFPLLFNAAQSAAVRDAARFRSASNGLDYKVSASLTDDAAKHYDQDIGSLLGTYTLRLVAETSDNYFFLNQPAYDPSTPVPRGTVYSVRREDIRSIKLVLPGKD